MDLGRKILSKQQCTLRSYSSNQPTRNALASLVRPAQKVGQPGRHFPPHLAAYQTGYWLTGRATDHWKTLNSNWAPPMQLDSASTRSSQKGGAKKGLHCRRRTVTVDVFWLRGVPKLQERIASCHFRGISRPRQSLRPVCRACTLFFSSIRWRAWPIRPARSWSWAWVSPVVTGDMVPKLSRDTDMTPEPGIWAASPCCSDVLQAAHQ